MPTTLRTLFRHAGLKPLLALAFGLLLFPHTACATDDRNDAYILETSGVHSDEELLRAALEASLPKYGPYTLSNPNFNMLRKRILQEVESGRLINITAQVTSVDWETALIPVRIPIDKGLSNFRLAMIDDRHRVELSRIGSLDQLKKLAIGVGEQWATHDIYVENGFRIVSGVSSHNGLYDMLMQGRFDYMPRSVEEAVSESAALAGAYPHLAIEPSFALYTPAPRYFFVSPRAPRLAQRLQAGLETMIANGDFDRYFARHYGPMIAQVGLCKRTIYRLSNASLSAQTPFNRKQLWFDPANAAQCGK